MTTTAHRYLHLDVFTDRPLEGNQLAVFPDGAAVDPRLMQPIAQEMNYSESTFLLPRERTDTDVRMRIFTPGRELPMAGHPTIGSTFALAHDGVIRPGQSRFVFALGVGPTPVDLEWTGGELAFAWMTQLAPRFGPAIDDEQGIARSLSIDAADIDPRLPIEQISCGVPFIYVPLKTREAVDRASLDSRALAHVRWPAGVSEPALFLFSLDTRPEDDATVYSRMFAAGFGLVEDPATGSASGPLGAYLVEHQIVAPSRAREIVSRQGVKMGRPSRIFISIGGRPGAITEVKVGGRAVLVGEGKLFL